MGGVGRLRVLEAPDDSGRGLAERAASASAFLLPLALYLVTLAPTVTLEDSGEFIAAAYLLGVPHPSGYPLWCLVVHPFTWLPWGTVAERVHLSSAVFAAASCWLVYRIAFDVVRDRRAALVGAVALSVSSILWSQAVVAEVYALNALFTALLLWLAVRWRDDGGSRWLYALAFSLGLGMTNHLLITLVGGPIFVWLAWRDWRAVLQPRVLVIGAVLLVLGLSVYAYLPLRATSGVPLNVRNPDSLEAIIAHVTRAAYAGEIEAARTAGRGTDLLLHAGDAWRGVVVAFGIPLSLLALLGLGTFPRDRRDLLWLTVGIALANTVALQWLMTAPYRPLWVYLQRVFYISAHQMVGVWVAVGAAAVLRWAATRGRGFVRGAVAAFAAAVVAAAWAGAESASHRGDDMGEKLALDLLDSAPPGAGFVPLSDDIVYPVLWARWVEGRRPDVELLSKQYGWDGDRYSVAMIGEPVSDQLRRDLPGLGDLVAVPRGIAYALVPPAAAARETWGSFVPLPGPPRDIDFARYPDDVFADVVRARYAAYHARLGAKRLAEGAREDGLRHLDRAEALDPGDPFVEVLLADIYGDLGVRADRRRSLLEAALRAYDQRLDDHTRRHYPVTRDEIVSRLRGLPESG